MTDKENLITLGIFEGHNIRQIWHDDAWQFSVVDVIAAMLDYDDHLKARKYWNKLKQRLIEEGANEAVMECLPLKLVASDGKLREMDCARVGTLFKVIQFVPALHRRERKTGQKKLVNSGVYAIVNSITQEKYIGSSRDVTNRFMQHRADLRRNRHPSTKLQTAWNQYGEDAFTFVLMESIYDESDLEQIEQMYVDAEEPAYNTDTIVTNAGIFAVEETRSRSLSRFCAIKLDFL